MWSTENSKRLIKKVTKEYGREILQEGSKSVLGLEDHLDTMVAMAMNIDKDCITLARQWRIVIERAAMTEGIDKVKLVLEQDTKILDIINLDKEPSSKEIEMELEQKAPTEEIDNQKLINEIEMAIEEKEVSLTSNIKNKDKLEDISSSKTAIEAFSLDQSI